METGKPRFAEMPQRTLGGRRRVSPGAWLAVAVLGALFAAAAAASEPVPEPVTLVRVIASDPGESARASALQRAAPEIIRRVATRLRLPAPPRLTIEIAPGMPHDPGQKRRLGLGGTVPWAAGLAIPAQERVILFADRVATYPHEGLRGVLAHEASHIVLHHALPPGRRVPRWFDEGLALVVERESSFGDAVRLAELAARGRARSLESLDAWWPSDAAEARDAYAQALSVVSFAERMALPGGPARLVEGMREGLPFERAFERAYGISVAALEYQWRDELRVRYLFMPILALGAAANMTLGVLALIAAARARWRRARRLREMEDQERREEAEAEAAARGGPSTG